MSDEELDTFFDNGRNQYLDPEDMDYYGQVNLEKLKNLRDKIDCQIKEHRFEFVYELDTLIRDWSGRLPNLQNVFRTDEIERLLKYAIPFHDRGSGNGCDVRQLIEFVIRTGYRNEPDLDDDGKPLLHRTTPIHHAARREYHDVVRQLFKIYNRFDVNYIDEIGLTHFHVACESRHGDLVEKFLKVGQDPNLFVKETGHSPLSLALKNTNEEILELLLRHGADPNAVSAQGFTLLHVLSEPGFKNPAEILFNISEKKKQPLQIDARDNLGNTPLHLALRRCQFNLAELLLEKGADPSLTDEEGSTALHICVRVQHTFLANFMFKIDEEKYHRMQVDARDNLGRTPLQLAVVNRSPSIVGLLLDRGADLSDFVFPSETFSRFFEKIYSDSVDYQLEKSSEMLDVIERLEKRGYELVRSDALKIMITYGGYKLVDESEHLDSWLSNADFVSQAKKITMNPSLSLYDLIQLRPDAAKNVVRREDYYKFANSHKSYELPEESRRVCTVHLYEKMGRAFFWRWALDSFLELTRYQLPILCCEKIIENLVNEDLLRLCQAAEIIANEQSQQLSYRSVNQDEEVQEFQNLNLNE